MDWQTIISYLDWKAFILLISATISLASLYFSRRSWSESNRPMITVKVGKNKSSGNNAIIFDLIVQNTGSRPAKEIKLNVDQDAVKNSFHQKIEPDEMTRILECFSSNSTIPILANGQCVKNAFGQIYINQEKDTLATKLQNNPSKSTWKSFSKFNVTVQYQDIGRRKKYTEIMPILIADNENGFAGIAWND